MRIKKPKKLYPENLLAREWHKHPFAIPVITFLMLFFASSWIFINSGGETLGATDTKIVQLSIDGERQSVPTRAHTVGDMIERLDLGLNEHDAIEPNPKTPITEEGFSVNIYKARPVTIIDENGDKTAAFVAASGTHALAQKAGVNVYPEDILNIAPPDETFQEGIVGEKIIIDRADAYTVNVFGQDVVLRTHAETVGELIDEKIDLQKGDQIKPSRETLLKKGLKIQVIRPGKKIITVKEKINAPVETREDPNAPAGSEVVIEEGADGERIVTYEIDFRNNKEVGRKETNVIMVKEAKKRIVIMGTQGFTGGFGAALAALRGCESGGNYSINTGNGFYGAYQFMQGSWDSFAPAAYKGKNPATAPPYIQDLVVRNYYQVSGWGPWPGCTSKLGLRDIYR